MFQSVCIFCASSPGHDKKYLDASFSIGKLLAEKNITLVYGGAKVGLMGAVADGVLHNNGKAIGVLPKFLAKKEIAHDNLSELFLVESMHERKMKMHELSDAAIALPGGFGTLEELFEILTWGQLGLHQKPVGLLNLFHFYDPLIEQISRMNAGGFLSEANQKMLINDNNPESLFVKMQNWRGLQSEKWLSPQKT